MFIWMKQHLSNFSESIHQKVNIEAEVKKTVYIKIVCLEYQVMIEVFMF